ncbi:homocysteine S-methyltransferase family protein [Puniceibacterium sediminis]|uniref:Homocysteine S-methyltransferase n=1 Tax=Puniceibacterium sediminis TaxID=1608407 RepID=A0A238Y1Y3_9RHOB|nr:homocysteine S-methyltransferase family protein [Puniceibacterium sediminis]SNR65296.1 homocysteine S-methyltransferase [Puniceibacterium sediminis]
MSVITLMDGGMGQELIHRAGGAPTPLWATQVMIDTPDLVGAVHDDFFAAGARMAKTNSYAVHRDRLVGTGYEDRFAALLRTSVDQAVASRDRAGGGLAAGCLGPLRASYRPDLHPPAEEAIPLYAEVAQILTPGCDLLICETVASLDHARSVLKGASSAGLPVWLSLTVMDTDGTRLRSGEPLAAVQEIAQGGAQAILVNCSAPEAIPAALQILSHASLPFGAYANGFERITPEFLLDKPTVESLSARRDLTPEIYADHVLRWADIGATLIGGCCEVGPAHIAAVAQSLTAAGYKLE